MSIAMIMARCHSWTGGRRANQTAHSTFDRSSMPTTANSGRSGTLISSRK